MKKTAPSLQFEKKLWRQGCQYVVGIDEVGRGALAGPVVVGVACFNTNHRPIKGVRDSKQLSAAGRQTLAVQIQHQALFCQIGHATVDEIDEWGIVPATMMAITRALQSFRTVEHLLMDGKPFTAASVAKVANWPTQPVTYIVKGDQLSYSIAAASIVAKVWRDELMKKEALVYPDYGWDSNVGYGTASHLAALKKFGLTKLHRQLFCRNISTTH